jgi:endonuclease G, mitochondrial
MRSDVQEVNNPSLAIALKQNRRPGVPLRAEAAMTAKDPPSKVETRINLIEPKERDPNGLERVFGTSDLLSINFLARGMQAAAAVARLRVRLPDGSGEWFGTGFLVAPGLLMTNNHVLPNAATAALAIAEFNHEHDLNGVEAPRRTFNLMPSTLFFTDSGYDVSFVEVAPRAFDGTPLSGFGYLPLFPAPVKRSTANGCR